MGKYIIPLFGGLLLLLLAAQSEGDVLTGAATTGNPALDAKVEALAVAISVAEGFAGGGPNAVPVRANNPGDLGIGDVGQGTIAAAGSKVTIFKTVTDGWNALYAMIIGWINGTSSLYNTGMTFYELAHTYVDCPNAPISQNSINWATNVCSNLGIDPGTAIQDWLNA